MPAVKFSVTWPDGDTATYYSPSTVIKEFFKPTATIDLHVFLNDVHQALDAASERVYKKYGYYCSAASSEQEKIQSKANQLAQTNINGNIQFKLVS